jgi:hypothetical protein
MPIYIDDLTSNIPGPLSGGELGANQKVTVTFDFECGLTATDGSTLEQIEDFFFLTTASPLYADPDYIILNGGELFEAISVAAIYSMSFAASTMVDDIILFDEDVKFPDHSTQAYRFFNRARTEFVKCKVSADILRAILSSKGTSAGRKLLADFSIDNAALANIIQQARPLLKDYIDCYQYWQKVLFSGGAVDFESPRGAVGVKGGNLFDGFGGIGRGWIADSDNLHHREIQSTEGNTTSRPRRYGH